MNNDVGYLERFLRLEDLLLHLHLLQLDQLSLRPQQFFAHFLSLIHHGRSFRFCLLKQNDEEEEVKKSPNYYRFADKVWIDVNLGVGGAVWNRGGAGNWLWMDHRPGWVDLLDPQVKLWEGSH